MTKEKIDNLLEELGRLGLGADGADVANKLQPARSDAAIASVDFILSSWISYRILSRALERIKDKLQDLPDRLENVGRIGKKGNIEDVSDLIDGIRTTVIDCQVSSRAQTRSAIQPADEPSPLHFHPAYPANYLHQHQEPSLDAKSWLRRLSVSQKPLYLSL